MRRLQVNLTAWVEVGAQALDQANCAISARVATGEPVAEWLDPVAIAALAGLGLTTDLSTGNLSHGNGGQINTLGFVLTEHKSACF